MRDNYTINYQIKSTENKSINILITGDFCPINRVEDQIKCNDHYSILKELNPFLQNNDISITNLECPLTESDSTIVKSGPKLKANPNTIDLLKLSGFNVVTLANNHCMDYGSIGLMDTIKLCNESGIETVGAGENIYEAGKPKYINSNGTVLGIVNLCEKEFSIATKDSAGANPIDLPLNLLQITEAKKNSDLVIVIVHGGNEGYRLPNPHLKSLLRFYVNIGASAVICHHSHVYSGFEVYQGSPIFYGLGNFIFDWKGETENDWHIGYIVNLRTNGKNINEFDIIPYKQYLDFAGLKKLSRKELDLFKKNLHHRSECIKDDEKLTDEWTNYTETISSEYLARLFALNRLQKALVKRGLFKRSLIRKKKYPILLNLLQCDSHREAMIKILKNS